VLQKCAGLCYNYRTFEAGKPLNGPYPAAGGPLRPGRPRGGKKPEPAAPGVPVAPALPGAPGAAGVRRPAPLLRGAGAGPGLWGRGGRGAAHRGTAGTGTLKHSLCGNTERERDMREEQEMLQDIEEVLFTERQ